jgi:hypothetical protein
MSAMPESGARLKSAWSERFASEIAVPAGASNFTLAPGTTTPIAAAISAKQGEGAFKVSCVHVAS